MTLGFDRPLYILPFDHRATFQKKMFGWDGELSPQQTAQIAAAKEAIYDGPQAAVEAGVPRQKAGILVDEQFGAAILRNAAAQGYMTSCPAERSGQNEFDFEHGEDFARHIEAYLAGTLLRGMEHGHLDERLTRIEAKLGIIDSTRREIVPNAQSKPNGPN